jgi:predicted nucleic acid-binding protein
MWLLDTNACIAIISGRYPAVRHRLHRELGRGGSVAAPSIAVFELWYGVSKSAEPFRQRNRERLDAFLRGPFTVLPFEGEDARHAGEFGKVCVSRESRSVLTTFSSPGRLAPAA